MLERNENVVELLVNDLAKALSRHDVCDNGMFSTGGSPEPDGMLEIPRSLPNAPSEATEL